MIKRITITAIFLWIMISPVAAFGILQGDVDNSGKIDLQDAVLALQICAGINVSIPVYISADVNGNQKIDPAEAIYVLQCLARLRNNHSPVLIPIGNKAVNEGATLNFTLSATDEDNDLLRFSATPLPNGATFNAATKTFSWTPTYSQSGTYQITFTARDDYGGSGSETVTIKVNNINQSPVLNSIGSQSVNENMILSFTISATDSDEDAITYSASSLPSGATFNASNRKFSWIPAYSQSGFYSVAFSANDDYGGIDSETITIAVNDVVPPDLFKSLITNVFTGGERNVTRYVTDNRTVYSDNSCGYFGGFYDRATVEENLYAAGGSVTSSTPTEWCGATAGESACLIQFYKAFVFDIRYRSPQQNIVELYMTGLVNNRMTVIEFDSLTYDFFNGKYGPLAVLETRTLDTSISEEGADGCNDQQQPTQTKNAIDGNWTGYKATYSLITMKGSTEAATVSCVNQSCAISNLTGVTITLSEFRDAGTWGTAAGAPKVAGATISADRQLLSMFVCNTPLDESVTFENCSFFTLKR